MCKSVPQIAVEVRRRSTSVGASRRASSTVSISSVLSPRQTTAFIVFPSFFKLSCSDTEALDHEASCSASSASSPCSTMSPSLKRISCKATRHFGFWRSKNSRSMPKCLSALNDLRQDGLDAIGWDGEPDAIGRRVELWIDGRKCGNTDHVALQVHQGPSTIARVNRRIGLDGIVDGSSALPFVDASFQGAHDAVGHRLRITQGVPDGEDLLPDFELRGVSQRCSR